MLIFRIKQLFFCIFLFALESRHLEFDYLARTHFSVREVLNRSKYLLLFRTLFLGCTLLIFLCIWISKGSRVIYSQYVDYGHVIFGSISTFFRNL